MKRLPSNAGVDVQFDLDMAIKGIVKEWQPPKEAPKPDLNLEDLGDDESAEYYDEIMD